VDGERRALSPAIAVARQPEGHQRRNQADEADELPGLDEVNGVLAVGRLVGQSTLLIVGDRPVQPSGPIGA
jgi:hypothetical protein